MLQKCSDSEIDLPTVRYLDNSDKSSEDQDTILLVSYPRSGNTLLRSYLEKVTGLATGSDSDVHKKLNKVLFDGGFAAEGISDKRALFVKSHYPERYGSQKFYAEKAILLVRNPLDCMASLLHLLCSGSHSNSISDSDFEKYKQKWTEFIQQDITVWKDFHEFWLNSRVPVHIVRYEDLVKDPQPTLEGILKFALNASSL